MFLDNSLAFQTGGWATAQALTTTADGSVVVDITGAGVGNAPAMISGFPASNTAIGEDWGSGDGVAIPYLYTTFLSAGASGNTITITVSSAPDNGSYSAGSYTVIFTSTAITESTIDDGDYLIVPLPPTKIAFGQALPRFYKITYTCSGAVTVSLKSGIIINPPSSMLAGKYGNNFVVV